jgi:RsiW-degrading membrane proteinase PrsW (M82 family)
MDLTSTIIWSFLGGILPSLFWLFYWLQEDSENPEPPKLIFFAFVYGMLMVPIALLLQSAISAVFLAGESITSIFTTSYFSAVIVLIVWSSIEEILKYVAAHKAGLSKQAYDEPIDAMIYLITAALGFSALENTLFIFSPILAGDTATAFITGNMRFIGATLLHISTSGIIGIFIAFSYYKNKILKKRYLLTGLVLSVALHTIFNSFIIRAEHFTLIGFSAVWILIVVIILLFEKIKHIYKPKNITHKIKSVEINK